MSSPDMALNDKSLFDKALRQNTALLETPQSDEQGDKLWAYHCAVVDANRRFNLTRVTEPVEAAVKHYADALSLLRWVRLARFEPKHVLDAGTGAGLPAAPLAIARPDWQVTAIDGTTKKVNFVSESAKQLGIGNLAAIHARAEHWDTDRRFDLVLFKAVGAVDRCLKWGRRLLARSGRIVIYKTADLPDDEISDGITVAAELGFAEPEVFRYELTLHAETLARALWVFALR